MYGDEEVCGCWVSQSIAGRTKKMYCARGVAAAGGKNGKLRTLVGVTSDGWVMNYGKSMWVR